MRLQVVRAIYKGGALIFTQPELTPRDGTQWSFTKDFEQRKRVRYPFALSRREGCLRNSESSH